MALLVCIPADRKGERADFFVFVRFCPLIFPERGAGGGVFDGSLPSVATLLVCMPADREGERAVFLFFLRFLRRSIFPEQGAGGGGWAGSLPSAAALLVCMPAGQESALLFSIVFSHLPFSRVGDGGWGFSANLYNRRWRFWYTCQRVGR